MPARAFNPQIFLEFLCYSAFGGLMFFLVRSGKYLSYVTPRMEPYLYFTAIVMGIWACAGLGRLFRPQYKVRFAHCLVLVIPILLLLLPHTPLSAADLSGKYTGGNAFSGFKAATGLLTADPPRNSPALAVDKSIVADDFPPVVTPLPDNPSDSREEYSTDLPGLDVKKKKITIANEDFGVWISELYGNMERYKGYTVLITGFVFKGSEMLQADEFVSARLMMTCCTADLAPVGLLCSYDKAAELKTDSWVTVEGTLFIGKHIYNNVAYDDPQISVTKITPAAEVKGYVTPY
ncbi:TIGR03943 family putative permease subunit [Desulfosporosinus meridiei]|uniref:TIGR03943 family protein n=1 Tax=Desulfosporosinus meridiei (strain ATCC BAA-275 / DSM 13257 / KCTC 12902 / NCIMB 13706 / S10) TaxID=768704 RepID=J7ITX1_DESMD|nr:TIGR03943 family protein [Desulfosporosinus meridiei]AFQ42568.1 TIGR03943 family protein [Desulfosporosinus meridiei DSM 13257]